MHSIIFGIKVSATHQLRWDIGDIFNLVLVINGISCDYALR